MEDHLREGEGAGNKYLELAEYCEYAIKLKWEGLDPMRSGLKIDGAVYQSNIAFAAFTANPCNHQVAQTTCQKEPKIDLRDTLTGGFEQAAYAACNVLSVYISVSEAYGLPR